MGVRSAAVLAILVALAGCSMARFAIPSTLAASPELTVANRQGWGRATGRPMTFGSFRADEIRVGWTGSTSGRRGLVFRTGSGEIELGLERFGSRQRLAYQLDADGMPLWDVRCLTTRSGRSIGVTRREGDVESRLEMGPGDVALGCVGLPAGPEATDEPWELLLSAADPGALLGTLRLQNGEMLDVRGSRALAGTSLPAEGAAGYVVEKDGRALAAIDVLGRGAVRIAPEAGQPERDAIAGAAVALLLLPVGPEDGGE